MEHEKCFSIVIDNFKAGYDVTKHLIDNGCKRILHVTGSLERNVYNERRNGYRKAMTDHGFEFTDDLLIVNTLSIQDGIETAQKVLQMRSLPDGIFVANDYCAASCMVELKRNGLRIPQDIAIAGFNNDPISTATIRSDGR